VYSYDVTYQLTKEEAKSVLGGEVALWSEQSDSMTLDMKLWPRAAAAAEMLWSGRYDSSGKQRDIGEAMPRMFDWRYRLVERGLRAEPIQPLWW
jgi:hexosaminidase